MKEFLEVVYTVLLSPIFTLVLSYIVLSKWTLKAIYDFEWGDLGAIIARLFICVLYAIIVVYNPPAPELRYAVRLGFNVLFLDETLHWIFNQNKYKLRRRLNRIRHRIEKIVSWGN